MVVRRHPQQRNHGNFRLLMLIDQVMKAAGRKSFDSLAGAV